MQHFDRMISFKVMICDPLGILKCLFLQGGELSKASKKKEAALAKLEAAHQGKLQDRWHMEGADREAAMPTQVHFTKAPYHVKRMMLRVPQRPWFFLLGLTKIPQSMLC